MKLKICSSEYVKTVSRGKSWIPAFLSLGLFLAFPVVLLLMIGNWSAAGYTQDQMTLLYESLWKGKLVITGGMVAAVAAIMNSINGFSYVYSRKKVDFYHSLPIKRSRMFWSRVYTGLLYYLIPYAVAEFFAVCIGAARGFFSLKLMGLAVSLFFVHLLLYLMLYFSVILIFCVTGNFLMGGLCLVGMQLYGPVLGILLSSCAYSFFDTFFAGYPYGIFKILESYASPLTLADEFVQKYREGQGMVLAVVLVVLTLIFLAVSYIAYIRRPSEAAGKPMVYGKLAAVLKFMVVVPCGIGTGFVFYLIPTSHARNIWCVFGLVLGTVLAHGMTETLYQMDFHAFFSKKAQLFAAGALVAVCALIYQKDLLRFDAYIPKQEEIKALNIDMMVLADDMTDYVKKQADGTFRIKDSTSWEQRETVLSGKDGIGNETYTILQKIVENQKSRKFREEREQTEEGTFRRLLLGYQLQSGRKVNRSYMVNTEECDELLGALYKEENLKNKTEQFLALDTAYLDNITLISGNGRDYAIFQDQPEKQKKLIEAVKKDFQEAAPEDLLELPFAELQMGYTLPVAQDIYSLVPGEKNPEGQAYGEIKLFPSYKNTIAVLKETGYPLSLKDTDIKKAKIVYYDESGEEEKTAEYTEKEQIEALVQAANPSFGDCSWIEYEPDVMVIFQTEQGEECYAEFLKDRTPEFVRQESRSTDKKENTQTDTGNSERTEVVGGADGPTEISAEEEKREVTDE